MPLLQVCDHLGMLASRLSSFLPDESYRIERMRHNLRLDFPHIHDFINGVFKDRNAYPKGYPQPRGANVTSARESIFMAKVSPTISTLDTHANRATRGDDTVATVATQDYLKTLENVWTNTEALTVSDACNASNLVQTHQLPAKLTRYVDFKTFFQYTLLPSADPKRWTPRVLADLMDDLKSEAATPGTAWRLASEAWHDARKRIRKGTLSFSMKPRHSAGELKFIGDGSTPVHRTSTHPVGSRELAHHVIRELALPSWEKESDRQRKLGLIAVETPTLGWSAYRPTVLDNFVQYSYFFLPADRANSHGLTWKLDHTLAVNSAIDYDGQKEWIVVLPGGGISCAASDGASLLPSFDLVGLEFGVKHASLFTDP